MNEKRSSPRFSVALCVRLDLKEKGVLKGTLADLSASGEGMMVQSDKSVQEGEPVTMELSVPVQMRNIRCGGEVVRCQRSNGVYEIGIRIRDIDERSREDIRIFCDSLMPSTESDTVNYLIQEGERALTEASKAAVGKSTGERLEAFLHELLSLKYHDALRSFENALTIDPENETAMEGFCYSLAKAISHYERAGLDGLADIIKVKALPYFTDKTLKVAQRSPRMDRFLLEIITS